MLISQEESKRREKERVSRGERKCKREQYIVASGYAMKISHVLNKSSLLMAKENVIKLVQTVRKIFLNYKTFL